MDVTTGDNQQVNSSTPGKSENHRRIIGDLLVAIKKQEDLMKQQTETLEFFRDNYKRSLDHDKAMGTILQILETRR